MPHDLMHKLLKVGDTVYVYNKKGTILDIIGTCQCVVQVPGEVILASAAQLRKAA